MKGKDPENPDVLFKGPAHRLTLNLGFGRWTAAKKVQETDGEELSYEMP